MAFRDYSELISRRYSISCEQIYQLAQGQLSLFLEQNPDASERQIALEAVVISQALTPAASAIQQLLELALQDQDLLREPLHPAVLEAESFASNFTLGGLLMASYETNLAKWLLEEIGLEVCLDCLVRDELALVVDDDDDDDESAADCT